MSDKTIGQQIAMFRRMAGLPQRVLAEAAGCNQIAISRIERGERRPTKRELRKLESLLGVRLSHEDGAQ